MAFIGIVSSCYYTYYWGFPGDGVVGHSMLSLLALVDGVSLRGSGIFSGIGGLLLLDVDGLFGLIEKSGDETCDTEGFSSECAMGINWVCGFDCLDVVGAFVPISSTRSDDVVFITGASDPVGLVLKFGNKIGADVRIDWFGESVCSAAVGIFLWVFSGDVVLLSLNVIDLVGVVKKFENEICDVDVFALDAGVGMGVDWFGGFVCPAVRGMFL